MTRKFFAIALTSAFVFAGGAAFNGASLSEAASIPSGSYKQSCKDISASDTGLRATCQRADGSWQKTSLSSAAFPCDDIENDNGELVCVGGN